MNISSVWKRIKDDRVSSQINEEVNESFANDPEGMIKQYLKEGGETVWIIAQLGDPQNDEYEPVEMYIKSLDDGVLSLSRQKGGKIVDKSPCDEVYLTKEDALDDLANEEVNEDSGASRLDHFQYWFTNFFEDWANDNSNSDDPDTYMYYWEDWDTETPAVYYDKDKNELNFGINDEWVLSVDASKSDDEIIDEVKNSDKILKSFRHMDDILCDWEKKRNDEEVNESEALNKKANDYLEKKGYHNYLKGDYDKNRLVLKMIKEKKVAEKKANEEQFAKFVNQMNESSEDDAREGYDYNGHTIQLDDSDDQWVVDDDPNLRFISQQGAEDFIDELESLDEDPEVESDEEEPEESIDELPQAFHVYWDKRHENAVYVIGVYEKDNKVMYYTDDNQRRETTIDKFMSKYEPSTNSDDYEIFED